MGIHSLFDQKVELSKEEHKYYDRDGREYMSFSRLFGYLSPKFDSANISRFVGKKEGISQQDVLNKWQNATDEGTRVDGAIKRYTETGTILEADVDLQEVIKKVCEKYVVYNSLYSDLVVYNDKYRVAGEIDRLALVSNRRDCSFHISDFKRFEKGMGYDAKGQKWLNYPFEYHLNSKYTKITWQLNYYAYLFSLLTGRKCERFFVDVIQPIVKGGKVVDYLNYEVPVANIQSDVKQFLYHFENRIITDLEPKTIIIEDEF